jgi:thiosulfate dehydrogenase [quinone] large subunit
MNVNYLLAGSTSTNPNLLVAALVLMLAWRTAGAWGLDRWLLPALGTPWRPGFGLRARDSTAPVISRPAEGSALS